MWIDTTYRRNDEEIMDDLEMEGDILIDSLDKIATINQWLGGNKLTVKAVLELLVDHPKDQRITIADLGCGNGDMLRALADVCMKEGYAVDLVGIDANQATIDYAIALSTDYDNIRYYKQDVLSAEFAEVTYDIALCTLFLHHFEDATALALVQQLEQQATIGVIVNDLHRHPMAYYLFSLITFGVKNHMMKADGKLSILKAFKRQDFERFASKLASRSRIRWKWAFRYQWLIYKNEH
jgi:2-polyprenyl-3-methyl-5-hydroxy-6-metoxy-1,4-benzoquinol methylase